MLRSEIIHERQHIRADKIGAENAGPQDIFLSHLGPGHTDNEQISVAFLMRRAGPCDRREISCAVLIVCAYDKRRLNAHGIYGINRTSFGHFLISLKKLLFSIYLNPAGPQPCSH